MAQSDCSWPLLLLEPGLFNNVYNRSEKGEDQQVSNSYWCGDGD